MTSSSWQSVKLGDLCRFVGGNAFPKSAQGRASGDVPFIKVSDLATDGNERRVLSARNWVSRDQVRELKARLVPEGAVVFAKIGEGLRSERLSCTTQPTALDNNLMAAIPIPAAVDRDYLYYLLGQVGLADWAQGSALPYLRQSDLESIQVNVPPLDEQRLIAEVLAQLDALIEADRALARWCRQLRSSLVEQAIRQADGQTPLSSLAQFVNGKNFTKNASGSGRPVIRTPELRAGPMPNTVRSGVDAPSQHLAQAGDILFVWSGSLMVERWLHSEGLVNQHIFKVIPNAGIPGWLVMGLIERQMPWFRGLAADKATTMGHIQRAHLDVAVPLPAPEQIASLTAVVEPLWLAELQFAQESLELATRRDNLQPWLISGQVRVGGLAA